MPLVSLHLESIVTAEAPVPNGQHRPVVWIADLYPQCSSLSFAFFISAQGLKTLLLWVLWDLLMRCWERPSTSSTSLLCTFLQSPSICWLSVLLQVQFEPLASAQLLSTTWSHLLNAPFVHLFSKLPHTSFFTIPVGPAMLESFPAPFCYRWAWTECSQHRPLALVSSASHLPATFCSSGQGPA